MKILLELVHPANVHYFKHFIFIMKKRGHEVLVIARDKEVTIDLLDFYNIKYVNRGKGGSSFFRKLIDIPVADFRIFKHALKFKPDIFISFGSMNMGHVSFLLGKPHISFDDTEHNWLNQKMYIPFVNQTLTPYCYNKNLGKKQIRFDGFMEFGSIHPNYFKPDDSIYEYLEIDKGEKFILLRFISWEAIHDVGQKGLSLDVKRKAVEELSKYARVFISSEKNLPEEFKPYQIQIPPEKMHDALYFAELFFGESGTMAVEAAFLGTPSVRVSTLAKTLGNFTELKNNYSLVYYYDESQDGLDKALSLIQDSKSKEEWGKKSKDFFEDKIDLNAFMIWFFETYPESSKIAMNQPELIKKNYQNHK